MTAFVRHRLAAPVEWFSQQVFRVNTNVVDSEIPMPSTARRIQLNCHLEVLTDMGWNKREETHTLADEFLFFGRKSCKDLFLVFNDSRLSLEIIRF